MSPGGSRSYARNARILTRTLIEHLGDDPVLLAMQVSRRLPARRRRLAGALLMWVAGRVGPVASGAQALGAVMAGDIRKAEVCARRALSGPSPSRLAAEVMVEIGRPDLLPPDAGAVTRARAAWSRGDLSGALAVLVAAGLGERPLARRLRSERDLLSPGRRPGHPNTIDVPDGPTDVGTTDQGPVRVLQILTNSLPHTQSGYTLRSHRILTALKSQGVEVLALTRTGYPVMLGRPLARSADVVDGIEYRRVLPAALGRTQEDRIIAQVEAALDAVRTFRPTAVHATTNYLNGLVAQEVSRRTGLPWIYEVRGFMEQTWIASRPTGEGRDEATRSEKAGLIAAREAELAGAADAVVTLSATMRDELVARGVDPSRISIVPNGVGDDLVDDGGSPCDARRSLGIDGRSHLGPEAVVVGAASALVGYEGFDVMLRAVARLVHGSEPSAAREKLAVIVVGDGTARPQLEGLAHELGINDRVHFAGRVPRADAPTWVRALDIVCVPRLDLAVTRAVTPQKPVEAMALGRPVVASDLPALRECSTTDVGALGALLVPPGDDEELAQALLDLVDDPSRRAELVSIGARVADGRRWSGLTRRYREVYSAARANAAAGAVS